jgi:curved DNA-binding protein CbpA
MRRVHTHYDNLKVARDAPPEVIRAAHKTLSQIYHPDKNPGNPEVARIMSIINASYEVLIDPEKRRKHDAWIVISEREEIPVVPKVNSTAPSRNDAKIASDLLGLLFENVVLPIFDVLKMLFVWALTMGGIISIMALIFNAIGFFESSGHSTSSSVKSYQPSPPIISKPTYARPPTAPNGAAWPTRASYIHGYKKRHLNGLSTVTIDNTRNDSDVFVKLVSLDGSKAYPVRVFFIPAFSSFTLNKVRAGTYDIRYRDLSTGALSRSESFTLTERETYEGIRYSNVSMTLYKVAYGNMHTYPISESEF